MSDLVGNPEDRFSHNEAHILSLYPSSCIAFTKNIYCSHIVSGNLFDTTPDIHDADLLPCFMNIPSTFHLASKWGLKRKFSFKHLFFYKEDRVLQGYSLFT